MLSTPQKAFLLVAGVTAAAVTAAYVTGALDRFITAPPQTIAALPQGEQPQAGQPGQVPAPTADRPTAPGAPAADAPAAPDLVPPAFDLVRVEPDGSLVIAGQAAPGAKVEILTGSKVIGATVAGPEGDFAVVLDDPLAPGAYQIVLRATNEAGTVAMSQETAVVSVPEQEGGQVLALVEKPGEPSKLITVPEPEAPKTGAESGVAAAGSETAAAPENTPVAEPDKPAGAGDVAAAPPPAGAPAQADTPAKPDQQVAAAPEQQPATPAAEAAATPKPDAAAAGAAPVAGPNVKVEAVEIEGSKVFVAGIADPGSLVRVYANDIFLGETTASPGGQFLVEALRDLPVGDYIIRADVIGKDGAEVLVRATVPFQREPGEAIAAVAAPQPSAPAAAGQSGQAAPAAAPSQPPAGSETPPAAVAEKPADPDQQPAGDVAEAQPPAGEAPAPVAQAPAAVTQAPAGETQAPAPVTQAPAGETQAPASAAAPPVVASAEQQPASSETAAGQGAPAQQNAVAPTSKPAGGGEPPSIAGASLQAVDGSVIIRRGDSLWRISRRVYGRGVRYSTIYLANQDQIADPDRIWPGQVFKVPEKTSEGEKADMEAIANRQKPVAEGDPTTATR